MCWGVGMSGLPMPRSMISAPRARAAALRRFTSEKTYGGARLILWNSGVTGRLADRWRPALAAHSSYARFWAFVKRRELLRPSKLEGPGLVNEIVAVSRFFTLARQPEPGLPVDRARCSKHA